MAGQGCATSESSLHVRDMDGIEFERKEWVVQRIGWVVISLLIVAAALGVFGHGPLTHRTGEAADGTLSVDYDGVIRNTGVAVATFRTGDAAIDDEAVTLRLGRDLVTGWRIEDINPKPSTESSDADWLIWEFDLLGDSAPVVEVHYRGDGLGRHSGEVRVGDGAPVRVSQWIQP